MKATISLEYTDEKTAQAIAQAISPDNFKTPTCLQISTTKIKNEVVTQIQCGGKLSTLTATIDDLISSVSVAEKTLKSINKI